MPEHVLALDLGTTSVRALVVRADGTVLSRARCPLATRFPRPGWIEQDPEDMWRCSLQVLQNALAEAGTPARALAGIGVVSQRSTALAWHAETGRALAPAIGWQDQRTAPRVEALMQRGIPMNTLASATKFEWLFENVPAVRQAAAAGALRLGTPDVWLTAMLSAGSVHVTDPGHASCTGLYDVAGRCWADGLLTMFGVERAWLPEVVPTSAVVAETPRELLGHPLPIAARAGDQQAAAFAQGVHQTGGAKLTIGTSAMLNVHIGSSPEAWLPGFFLLPLWELSDGERAFCVEGTVITAASALDWLVDLGLLASADRLDDVVSSVDSAEGVVFVPSLQGLGSPFMELEARGVLSGLTRGSGVPHVVRAVAEGVVQRCVDVCESVEMDEGPLRVDGGLAQSDFLLGRLADFLGRPVERTAEIETTALGAACLAGLATGVYRRPCDATAHITAAMRFEPRIDSAKRQDVRVGWRRALARARAAAEPPTPQQGG